MDGLFGELSRRLDAIAGAARDLLKAELEQQRLGIPGTASWNGYNASGQATVKKNGKILVVATTSKLSIPIGTSVYVDETLTVDYKQAKPDPKKPPTDKPEVKNVKRPKKKRRLSLSTPPIIDDVKGATWLVYHEYLSPLSWTTAAEVETNPPGLNWSLFLSLLPLVTLGGGVLFGAILYTLFQYHVQNVPPINVNGLTKPSNHPDIGSDSNISGDDYSYFFILQGVVDQLFTSQGLLAFPPVATDGFWLGKNTAIGNYIFFIGQLNAASYPGTGTIGGGLTYSSKYFIRPWAFSATDNLVGLLIHYGPGKVQAALYRLVGVYPSKRFKVNINSWDVPDRALPAEYVPPVNTGDSYIRFKRHKQFTIPDDIPDWNTILGNGFKDSSNEVADIIPYEIVPAHNYYEPLNEEDAYTPSDLTKFASYSQNSIFLNYIVKAYAPWTNLDDSLRINYYILTLQATNDPTSDLIAIRYNLNPSTFNLPKEFKYEGNIYLEDPNFPLQAGDRNVMERTINYKIQGTDDGAQPALLPIAFDVVRGESAAQGFLPFIDPDWSTLAGPKSFQISNTAEMPSSVADYAELNKRYKKEGKPPIVPPAFEIQGAPPGFKIEPTTGQFIMEQNVEAFKDFQSGWLAIFDFEYFVTSKGIQIANGIQIKVIGADITDFVEDPPDFELPPPYDPDLDQFASSELPSANPWDPEPIIESEEIGEDQFFEKIRVEIPFPETDEGGNVFGWQGRNPEIILEDVEEPVIGFILPNGEYTTDPSIRTALGLGGSASGHFIFSRDTNATASGDKAVKFITDFTVKRRNYDILPAGLTVVITYTLKAKVNNAPYVGNFEDLSDFQHRKIRSDMVAYAYPQDWRSKIYNPRNASQTPYFSTPTDVSVTRDENLPLINIDLAERATSYNYIIEFPLYAVSGGTESPDPVFGLGDILGEDFAVSIVTSRLKYKFDETAQELLFFAFDDLLDQFPLDYESVVSILQNNGQQVLVKEYFSQLLLPTGFDRNDASGKKWRWNYQRSKPTNAFLIFGYLPD